MPESPPKPETEAVAAVAAVAQAVSGRGSPEAATVTSAPSGKVLWTQILAGPALSFMVSACVGILAFWFWPDAVKLKAVGVMDTLVKAVACIAVSLSVMLGLVVFRLDGSRLKKFEAKAGPGSVTLETGGN